MTTINVRPGEGRHHLMIDGDHIAKATVQDACGAFEVFESIAPAAPMAPPHLSPWRFFADFANSVPAGRPVEDVLEAILLVTKRHSGSLAGNALRSASGPDTVAEPDLTSGDVRG